MIMVHNLGATASVFGKKLQCKAIICAMLCMAKVKQALRLALNLIFLVLVIGGQLRINFLSKILKFFYNCWSLPLGEGITEKFKILRGKLIRN